MQGFKANLYLGKRLKMTGIAKYQGVERSGPVSGCVSTGPIIRHLVSMQDRPIKGTTGWTKYQIVLDVPDSSVHIAFGFLLEGPGQVWVSDIQFEVVSENFPTTDLVASNQLYPDKPVNLNFEE